MEFGCEMWFLGFCGRHFGGVMLGRARAWKGMNKEYNRKQKKEEEGD